MSSTSPEDLRVMHVTEAAAGGVRRHLGYIVPELAKVGVRQSAVLSFERAEDGFRAETMEWERLGCVGHVVPMVRGLSWRDIPHIWALRRAMRRDRPAIVHAHATKAGLLSRLAAPAGVRVVYSPHSFAFQGPTGVAGRMLKLLERLLVRRTNRFVFVSDAETEVAQAQLGVPAEKIRVIPNGLPRDWADCLLPRERVRQDWGVAAETRVIAVPARLARQKGHDWLFRALAELSPAPSRLQVLLLGEGPLRAELEALGEQLGIASLLRWPGYVPTAPRLLAGADLVVVPSRHEGLPYALLESLAAGVPLLLSDIPGNVPHTDIRQAAQTVPLGDVHALSQALRDFLDAPETWRERARPGPDLVRRHWSLDRQIADLVRCYREL